MKRIAVIGAGIGGLTAAIRLARRGHDVHVYEQGATIGGKAGSRTLDRFRFDTGPSLLTMPFVLRELFADVGTSMDQYLDVQPLSLLTRYYYADGTILDAHSDREAFLREVLRRTDESSETVQQYFEYSRRIYHTTADLFLFRSLGEPSTFLNREALRALTGVHRIDAFRSMHRANASFFRDTRLVQLFDRYATYNGSNPFTVPATLNIISHVEHSLGGYYVRGGMHKLPEALHKLAIEMGARFHLNTPVQAIRHENNRILGIDIREGRREYDVVVSNTDVHHTYEKLLDDRRSRMARRYAGSEPSSSALVFFWGMKGRFDSIDVHNIMFSMDYRAEFEDIFSKRRCHDDPTVYIYVSSKLHGADAPPDCENWFVMINAPSHADQDWGAETRRIRAAIIRKINAMLAVDIEPSILVEEVMTPEDIQRKTASNRGSIYGISSNSRFSAFLRQQGRSRRYRGLYFCGGSAHPGGGIPLCVLSGKIAAELIQKYE